MEQYTEESDTNAALGTCYFSEAKLCGGMSMGGKGPLGSQGVDQVDRPGRRPTQPDRSQSLGHRSLGPSAPRLNFRALTSLLTK